MALALPVLAIEGASQLALPWLAVAVPIAFVGLQALLTAWRSAPRVGAAACGSVISLAFVGIANAWLDPTGTWPLLALAIPVVALAASQGGAIAIVIGIAGMALMLLPLGLSNFDPAARQRMLALAMAADRRRDRQPARRSQPGAVLDPAPPGQPARSPACPPARSGRIRRSPARS